MTEKLITWGQLFKASLALTKSLRDHLVKCIPSQRLHPQIHCYFLLENVLQKILIFFQQKITVYMYLTICNMLLLTFNKTLTNEVFNFEQPAPGRYYSTPSFGNCLFEYPLSPYSEASPAKCDLVSLLHSKSQKKCHKNFENWQGYSWKGALC